MIDVMINELNLDLACGDRKLEGYKGIDYKETSETDYIVDLQKYPWPIESDSAENVFCHHYLEHIPHTDYKTELKEILAVSNSFDEFKVNMTNCLYDPDGLIKFMNELYRIMKPGGKATIIVPYYTSFRAYGDPTHTRYITEFSFHYFNKAWRVEQKLEHYDITCDFDATFSYKIVDEMGLKSEEVRQKMFTHNWNVIEDLLIELIKR